MQDEMKSCPNCQSPYAYQMRENFYVCPECGFEWDTTKNEPSDEIVVKDTNGNILKNGDSVTVAKDLPVKGSSKTLKAGTKVKNIKLVEGEHNIDCKIEGFGSMALKSEFVKKA